MTAATFLATLRSRGVTFKVAGDRLRFCPAALVTEEERTELVRRKPEILSVLMALEVFLGAVLVPVAFDGLAPAGEWLERTRGLEAMNFPPRISRGRWKFFTALRREPEYLVDPEEERDEVVSSLGEVSQ